MRHRGPVLIAGGGIAGLALALALARRGLRSTVLERQSTPTTAGAGIQLGPNGVRALQHLGVAEALSPWAGTPASIEVMAGATGRRLAGLPLGAWIAARHGAPYWVAHRGDLHGVLAQAAAAESLIEIRTGFEVAAVAQTPEQATVTDASGNRLGAPTLVGADGLWSTVRHALAPAAEPRPAAAVAMRTVIPAAQAGDLASGAIGLWLSPEAHVVHYPVRRGSETAVVVIAQEAGARQGRGWDADADPGGLRRRLGPFHPRLAQALAPGPGRDLAWRQWSLHTLPPLPGWVQGRIALLGDAAHPMLPYLAQGGALALEDAIVLADCLQTGPDPRSALARFQALRAARARRVQAASRRQGRIYHLAAPFSWARNATLALAPGARLMAGYDWLYAWRPPA